MILWKTRANLCLGLLSKKSQPRMRTEKIRLLICNEYFLGLNFEGALYRCKNLSRTDISYIKTLRS